MSSDYNRAEMITLERVSEIYGHETAHLTPVEQHAIAANIVAMFARSMKELVEEMAPN